MATFVPFSRDQSFLSPPELKERLPEDGSARSCCKRTRIVPARLEAGFARPGPGYPRRRWHARQWVNRHAGAEVCEWRRLIGNFFREPEEFERTAMRRGKTDRGLSAMIHLAAAIINSR